MSRRQKSAPMSFFSFQDIITATTGILILLAMVLALAVITQGAESEMEIEVPQASDEQVAYLAGLKIEIANLKKRLEEAASETKKFSTATPEELEIELDNTNAAISRLERSIVKSKSELRSQEELLKDLQNDSTADSMEIELDKVELSIEETNLKIQQIKTDNRVVYNFRQTGRTPWLVQVAGSQILAARLGTKGKPKSFSSALKFNQFVKKDVPDSQQYFVLIVRPSGISNLDTIKGFLVRENMDIGVELIGESTTVIDPESGLGF